MTKENTDISYCIKIDYLPDSSEPSRIFRAMSDLIDSFNLLDLQLIRSIDVRMEPELLLENIEIGSLKTWLYQKISMVDDKDLRELNWKRIIGTFLVDAKHKFLEFRESNPELINSKQIEPLQQEILKLAQATEISHLPTYAPIPKEQLIRSYNNISKSISVLRTGDTVRYISHRRETNVVEAVNLDETEVENLLVSEEIASETTLILKVKKPDYLGYSQWRFKHGDHPIDAKISDKDWLIRFHDKKITVSPGDSLRAKVKIVNSYSDVGDVVRTTYEIVEVLKVIRHADVGQLKLNLDKKE